ncbi:hypothetical protein ECAE60S_04631 [Eoetvoesiella caeni]|uniref:DUF2933 family protein n=3 Tax=Eoetvoesiella caeni TaxID=645616 RepID=A0A366GXW6_9BURK|nr:DUF2933 family protein [Eoetvoesiella caeni]
MKCDMKTMVKFGLGLGTVVALTYATLPVAREWIAASTPFLFLLICPLMMAFMMKGMPSYDREHKAARDQADKTPHQPLIGQTQHKE